MDLDNFDCDVGGRFTDEYNFHEHWLPGIQIEAIENDGHFPLPLTVSKAMECPVFWSGQFRTAFAIVLVLRQSKRSMEILRRNVGYAIEIISMRVIDLLLGSKSNRTQIPKVN